LILSLEVDNKNTIGIPLQSFEGFVYFKTDTLVPVKTVSSVLIAAKQKSVIRISIPISLANLKQVFGATWKDVFTNIPSGLRPGNYSLQGTLTFNVSNILTKFPINEPFYVS
jgi:LEA14-like dessication related protein